MAPRRRLAYERRVKRVIDYIATHLADDLSLAGLARVATFSPFHFDRVFKTITGETLFGFVQRLRLEKAAAALRDHPNDKVLAVALDHGFASAATFARAFRVRFGMTATQWRAGGAERWRARERAARKAGKPLRTPGKARSTPRRHAGGREVALSVRLQELPTYHVAAMRYVGPYGARGIPGVWARLLTWMAAHDLDTPARLTLGIAYDDPAITAAERLRYDACVVVPPDFPADGSVDLLDVPGGRYAVAEFTGTAHQIVDAWDDVFREWLPASGWEPADRPCFELYRGDPGVAGQPGRFRCELCLPVRRSQ